MMLKAGTARCEITPRKPMFLVGYPHVPRTSEGVHDPLWATALYLSDGERAIMFIALDICYIHHDTARECRAAIQAQTGVPEANILIGATHTHSGPVTWRELAFSEDPVVTPADPEYMGLFSGAIIRAGVEAHAAAAPAVAAVTSARAVGVGGNRLGPDGVADPEVGILYLKRKADGSPLALDMVYSMHPTVLHEDSKLVSSDFPAYARQRIEQAMSGITVAYHTGPAGNQSPRYHVKGQTFAEAERLGFRLGDAVLAAVGKLRDGDFSDRLRVAAGRAFVKLPPRQFLPVPEAQARLDAARERYERLKREGAPHGPVRTAECVTFGAEEALLLARRQADGEVDRWRRAYTPSEVQVLRVGDTFYAGLPGELFVEYGLEIKKRAPGKAYVISMANGELQGYIVTPEADRAGGYEAACSFFTPDAGRIMVEEALRLMGKIA